jgi:hypothetical protein
MSNISTIYDALISRIEALLPNHQRLGNPYNISDNPDPYLVQGYGLALRNAVNTERLLNCSVSIQRNFTLHLTRRFIANPNDADQKATTEKLLLEDLKTIAHDMEENFQLSDDVAYFKYVSDNGIDTVRDTQENYLVLSVELQCEYFETY